VPNLLVIKSSILGAHSASNELVDEYVMLWKDKYQSGNVVVRDFSESPIPHLSGETFAAFLVEPGERDESQNSAVALSDELISEFMAADQIVIGMPMYNLSVPSSFKAYIDHITRAGVTFQYTEEGPVGLAGGRSVLVLGARGGVYKGTPMDLQTPYLDAVMGLIGIEKVTYINAEGLALGPEVQSSSMSEATSYVRTLFL